MDLGLYNRTFTTGTVIKLYSYDLPAGSRSVISRDLNQSVNEYLFSPALPLFTIDKPQRYPQDRNLQRELYGLKHRLEEEESKYISNYFSDEYTDEEMGRIKVTCYVFRPNVEEKSAKETKETIQREFFKNRMAVLFSISGQVHGHYTSEFITRALKFPLLKDYLLIHVDCTDIRTEFRNELFMASRDRLKNGEESRKLRQKLTTILTTGRLKEIYKVRKASITVESQDTQDLLRNFTRNLPLREELMHLLGQTVKLEERRNGRAPTKKPTTGAPDNGKAKPAFLPQRFPSFLKIDRKTDGGIPVVQVPLGDERTIRFSTDAEDQYFDRENDPGELTIALLDISRNTTNGGMGPGLPDRIEECLNVVKSSPHQGTIRVTVNPTQAVQVGDAMKLRAELTGAGQNFETIFFVKITDPERQQKHAAEEQQPETTLGLPQLLLVYKDGG
jgi:hypothetical protein